MINFDPKVGVSFFFFGRIFVVVVVKSLNLEVVSFVLSPAIFYVSADLKFKRFRFPSCKIRKKDPKRGIFLITSCYFDGFYSHILVCVFFAL